MVRCAEQVLRVQMSQVPGVVVFDFPYDVAHLQATLAGRSGVHLKHANTIQTRYIGIRQSYSKIITIIITIVHYYFIDTVWNTTIFQEKYTQ